MLVESTPKAVPTKAVFRKGVSPKAVPPKSVSPKGVPPKGVSPKSVAPKGVSPKDVPVDLISSEEHNTLPKPTFDFSSNSPSETCFLLSSPVAGSCFRELFSRRFS